LKVTKLKPGTYRLKILRTGFKANDAYSQYIAWGMPKDLSAEQIATLQKLSNDAPEADLKVSVGADGVFRRTIPMRTNDVILVKLEKNAR
jgi:xylan 1,4-beta-xylosidase